MNNQNLETINPSGWDLNLNRTGTAYMQAPLRPAPAATHGSRAPGKVEESISYMMQHLDKPLYVSRLAAVAKVSPSHFSGLFKRATGHAPIDFFIHLRMRRACELLERTSMSVKEVAAALGYDDQFYFSRVFKSVNNVAPTDYRLALAENSVSNHKMSGPRTQKERLEDPSSQYFSPSETTGANGQHARILHDKNSIIHSLPELTLR